MSIMVLALKRNRQTTTKHCSAWPKSSPSRQQCGAKIWLNWPQTTDKIAFGGEQTTGTKKPKKKYLWRKDNFKTRCYLSFSFSSFYFVQHMWMLTLDPAYYLQDHLTFPGKTEQQVQEKNEIEKNGDSSCWIDFSIELPVISTQKSFFF